MSPKARRERIMAESQPTLSSQKCYDSTGNVKPFDIPCGGWSEKFNSSLCCPTNYQCMRNGLCMLPDDQTTSNGSGARTYSPLDPAREVAAWVQLPTCTSQEWRRCAFNPLNCFNDGQSVTTGFFPKTNSCPAPGDRTILPGDWISCGSDRPSLSSCSSTQTAYDIWGPLGDVLCPAVRDQLNTSTSCTGTPYGVHDASKAGAWVTGDEHGVPVVIVYPIVIFVCIGLMAALSCFLLRRRRKRTVSARLIVVEVDRRRSRDSWDQGLPAYERHASGPEWPVIRTVETVWGEPPPEYCPPKQPEAVHVEVGRDVDAEDVEAREVGERP